MIWEGGRTEEWEVLEVKADPVDGGGSSLSIASARFLIAKYPRGLCTAVVKVSHEESAVPQQQHTRHSWG